MAKQLSEILHKKMRLSLTGAMNSMVASHIGVGGTGEEQGVTSDLCGPLAGLGLWSCE